MPDDVQTRLQGFTTEVEPLLKKYRFAFGSQAGLTPDGRIASQPVMVDLDKVEKVEKVEAPVIEHGLAQIDEKPAIIPEVVPAA